VSADSTKANMALDWTKVKANTALDWAKAKAKANMELDWAKAKANMELDWAKVKANMALDWAKAKANMALDWAKVKANTAPVWAKANMVANMDCLKEHLMQVVSADPPIIARVVMLSQLPAQSLATLQLPIQFKAPPNPLNILVVTFSNVLNIVVDSNKALSTVLFLSAACNKEASNKEVSNKEASNKEVSNKEASTKEVSNKEASTKEVSNKEASTKEVSNKANLEACNQANMEDYNKEDSHKVKDMDPKFQASNLPRKPFWEDLIHSILSKTTIITLVKVAMVELEDNRIWLKLLVSAELTPSFMKETRTDSATLLNKFLMDQKMLKPMDTSMENRELDQAQIPTLDHTIRLPLNFLVWYKYHINI